MNEPQSSVRPQKEVPPPPDSSHDRLLRGKLLGDDDGMQAVPAPDLDDPDEHAKDDFATDDSNT